MNFGYIEWELCIGKYPLIFCNKKWVGVYKNEI